MKQFRVLLALLVFMSPAIVFSGAAISEPAAAETVIYPDDEVVSVAKPVADTAAVVNGPASMADRLSLLLMYVLTASGAASVIVAALKPIARLTATQRDDEFLAKAGNWLGKLTYFLDKYVALNPAKSNARNG